MHIDISILSSFGENKIICFLPREYFPSTYVVMVSASLSGTTRANKFYNLSSIMCSIDVRFANLPNT